MSAGVYKSKLASILWIPLFVISGLNLPTRTWAEQTNFPNVVYILLDDVGVEDIGAYGNTIIKTPTIDSLASSGVRFTQHYSAGPVCSPTRIALMTGHYPRALNTMKAFDDESTIGIPEKVLTLPEILKSRGFRTVHAGKWHMGESDPQFLPKRVGFDTSLRRVGTTGDHTDFSLSLNQAPAQSYTNGEFLATTLTDFAVDFILSHKKQKPFFLYLAHLSAHAPYVAPPNFDNSTTQYDLSRSKERFFALITQVDSEIQRVLDALESRGMTRNTLVIVAGDNGTPANVKSDQATLRSGKTKLFEGGIKVPFIARWPKRIQAGSVNSSLSQTVDLLPTLAEIVGFDTTELKLPGRSLLKALVNNKLIVRSKPLFWTTKNALTLESSNNGAYDDYAVRLGSKKLIYQDDRLRLFDIESDPTEQTDVINSDSGTAASLQALYDKWRRKELVLNLNPKISGHGAEKVGKSSFRFKKKSGRVIVKDLITQRFGDDDFSFDLLVNPKNIEGIQNIVGHEGFNLRINQGVLELLVYGVGNEQLLLSGPVLNTKELTRVTVTFYGWKSDFSNVRLYIDGVLFTADLSSITSVKTSSAPLRLGGGFVGKIKHFRAWPLSLTPEEVAAL